MGVRWRVYQPGDVFKVRIRAHDPMGFGVEDANGPAWTLWEGDKALMVWGFVENAPGIASMWAYISDDARGHGVAIVRFGKQTIDEAFRIKGYHRIQSLVRSDKPEYMRFTELFGFQKEGLMRKATPEKLDLWLYSRVTE